MKILNNLRFFQQARFVKTIRYKRILNNNGRFPFSCHILLQCLSYCMEIDEHFALHNYHGKEEAVIQVQIQPCDARGNLLDEDNILEPFELIGKPFHVTIKFPQYMGVRWTKEDKTRGVYCKYV